MILVDKELSTRLELTEAHANFRFVEARAKQSAHADAAWIEVAGAFAMFDGPDSPLTQSFGLGMRQEVTSNDFEQIEAFYRERMAPVFHEVSPLASMELVSQLNERHYEPMEYTNVMCRRLGPDLELPASDSSRIRVRAARPAEAEMFAECSARGWSDNPDFYEMILGFGRTFATTQGATGMLAELENKEIATGVVFISGRVALLAGGSTIPAARKQGAQSALLEARLKFAIDQGCDLAMMCALPGSPSQRNAQRNGFQIAYTRTKWRLTSRDRSPLANAASVGGE